MVAQNTAKFGKNLITALLCKNFYVAILPVQYRHKAMKQIRDFFMPGATPNLSL
jgi:hypothetical protein